MSEQSLESVPTEAIKRPATAYTEVELTDGRKVSFAGKRKLLKATLIDESKVAIDEDNGIVQFERGAISIQMDFRNGQTRLLELPLSLIGRFAGHGAEQKFGDELAAPSSKPLSEDDMVLAIDSLYAIIQKGEWGKGRAAGGGGVAGAGIVIRAIVEASGKTIEEVKAFVEKKLASDDTLTRPALYNSFRAPGTRTGVIIARMEAEKIAKQVEKDGLDADAALGDI